MVTKEGVNKHDSVVNAIQITELQRSTLHSLGRPKRALTVEATEFKD